jgi:hypothetical protein
MIFKKGGEFMNRRGVIRLWLSLWLVAILVPFWGIRANAQSDFLPSWNDGSAKRTILLFVKRVTTAGSQDYVTPAERIAVLDNDGTLWAEQPFYFQIAFAFDRVKALAPQHPEWKEKPPFKAILDGDQKSLLAGDGSELLEIFAAVHGGMTTAEFEQTVSEWIRSARHPQTKRLYVEMVYQPMLELLAHLRANGFKTYIVSGGGIDFIRPWVERVYGIPPEQVVGSSLKVKFEMRANGPVLVYLPEFDFVNDKEGKPVGIHRFIGRRPILAFGNSDGDLQMLQWTAAGRGARLMGLIHHTDAEREWAYDRKSPIGGLDKALEEARMNRWTVVNMKRDWKVIYPFEKVKNARRLLDEGPLCQTRN